MSRVNKKQFQQMELPIQVDEPKIKAPHQMTPEEFASHPFAVFHSTHLPADQVKDPDARTHPGIHLGTERAASQRHLTTGKPFPGLNLKTGMYSYDSTPASMHVFHHDPGQRVFITSDDRANDWYGSIRKGKRNAYYSNDTEDRGSLSLVVHNPSRLKSQHDYVEEAIKQGKGEEVHPHTMKLYKQGVLKKGFDTPYWVSKQRVLSGTSDQTLSRYNHFDPNHPKIDFDLESMSPDHKRSFSNAPTIGKDDTTSKGPHEGTLKAEIKKRRKSERPK